MGFFFFSSRRRHTRCGRDWSSDVCSSDLPHLAAEGVAGGAVLRLQLDHGLVEVEDGGLEASHRGSVQAVDAEFQRIMTRVLLVGGAMGVIAAGALVVAFRA